MYVYFVRAESGPIKIGVAWNPQRRLANLQSASHEPLSLIAVMRGTGELERDLHRRFAAGRIRGEWFRADTPGLHELIAWLLRFDGDDFATSLPCEICHEPIEGELRERGKRVCWSCRKATVDS